MQLQLRKLPTILLFTVTLTLAACGGSADPDQPSADTGTARAGSETDPSTAEPDTPAESAEPTEPTEATEQAVPDEGEWVVITDEPSGITFAMPELAEPQANNAAVADGESVALRNYSTMSEDDIEVGFNVIDTPGTDYDFDAGIEGVAATLGGEVVSSTQTRAGGLPAVDVEMTYGEDYLVFFQLVTGEDHIVQSLASGPKSEREAVRQTYQQLIDSVTEY